MYHIGDVDDSRHVHGLCKRWYKHFGHLCLHFLLDEALKFYVNVFRSLSRSATLLTVLAVFSSLFPFAFWTGKILLFDCLCILTLFDFENDCLLSGLKFQVFYGCFWRANSHVVENRANIRVKTVIRHLNWITLPFSDVIGRLRFQHFYWCSRVQKRHTCFRHFGESVDFCAYILVKVLLDPSKSRLIWLLGTICNHLTGPVFMPRRSSHGFKGAIFAARPFSQWFPRSLLGNSGVISSSGSGLLRKSDRDKPILLYLFMILNKLRPVRIGFQVLVLLFLVNVLKMHWAFQIELFLHSLIKLVYWSCIYKHFLLQKAQYKLYLHYI